MKAENIQRFIDQLGAKANEARAAEGTMSVGEQRGEDGTPELFLTIENTIEDRAVAYMRMLRMRQVLKKSRTG